MPSLKNKNKAITNGKTKYLNASSNQSKDSATISCLTLEDETTRCNQPATEGFPHPERRCKVHQAQYLTMYKKYMNASKDVDNIRSGGEIPTKEQIQLYTDLHATLEKACWVRKYLESIRVERTGRNIHQRRFFLKVDYGHKIRLEVLAKEMAKAVEILNSLQARVLDLRTANNVGCDWMKPVRLLPSTFGDAKRVFAVAIIEAARQTIPSHGSETSARTLSTPADVDLIDLEHRAQKARRLHAFEIFTGLGSQVLHDKTGLNTSDPTLRSVLSVMQNIFQQYARRIILHEPDLFFKSLDKVSFTDLILDDDFSDEDMAKFVLLFQQTLGLGLELFKDAVLDALVMSKGGTADNADDLSRRHQVLGGWIYDCAYTHTIPNEAWWHILQCLKPPANVENQFVRLCNNFDDIINFLSFGAIGMIPPPTFCSTWNNGIDAVAYRNHLSLSGVVVADMVSYSKPPYMTGSMATRHRGRTPGCIVWVEIEMRGYMFGALRNESDAFNDAFLRELSARPDLFQVITRSETDPGREIEVFGAGPAGVLPAIRHREFEAPLAPFAHRPTGSGEWVVTRSALDILYGTHVKMPRGPKRPFPGYLRTMGSGQSPGWFFRFKKFPVKYIVILDTVPNRDHSILAKNVAWAALCARGYGEGGIGTWKYARASDKLFQKRAEELHAWMPEGWGGWQATMKKLKESRYLVHLRKYKLLILLGFCILWYFRSSILRYRIG
ncbi:hypothetical protein DEU56DRAFT_242503 [Suillus clintonianus]|uniref:uncharacterized protein n=1 Tax=Suillus clintonianus TaxID=1904413 RepID=UPI001B86ED01|nr:uncharacterized protein DEU56DRAFT_242503 [Suillus clintonianus]KAG2143586.1 hypothetical protein DEU56DRAFT_242503 [Suillus clintonianus]